MKLYMCGTDWDTELGPLGPGIGSVHSSIDILKECQPCWKECGIVEVTVEKISWPVPPEEEEDEIPY